MEFRASDNLAEQVARYLSERIVRLELKPGERILEAKIAAQLGVSRAPVREALRILERNRLVELIPRRGARVTDITDEEIHWLYEVLFELYGIVARKCVETATPEDFQQLEDTVQKLLERAREKDVAGFFDAMYEYASIGIKAAKNPLLEQLILELWPLSQRAQYASLHSRGPDVMQQLIGFFQQANRSFAEQIPDKAEKSIRDLVEFEKNSALKLIREKKK